MAQKKATATGRPEVIVEFLFDRGMLSIAVRNIGTRAARKVEVSFDRSFTGLGGSREMPSLSLFKNLEFLGPAREIITLLDTSASYFMRKQPTTISARVSYLDAEDQKYEATMNHNLEIYRELSWASSTSIHEVQ